MTTHSFNAGQRLVDLPIATRTAGTGGGGGHDQPGSRSAGWYMLFLLDERGVPSEARWIRLM